MYSATDVNPKTSALYLAHFHMSLSIMKIFVLGYFSASVIFSPVIYICEKGLNYLPCSMISMSSLR